jgi:hypothetical protein
MSDQTPVVVRTFLNAIEAELARTALEAAGIDARVHSDDAGGVYPGMWTARGVQLLVNPDDQEAAERTLAALEDPASRPDPLDPDDPTAA